MPGHPVPPVGPVELGWRTTLSLNYAHLRPYAFAHSNVTSEMLTGIVVSCRTYAVGCRRALDVPKIDAMRGFTGMILQASGHAWIL